MECLVGLGANLGDRRATLNNAAEEIAAIDGVEVLAVSGWLATAPVGGPDGQDEFLNGAVRLETGLAPEELLRRLRKIEAGHGRERRERWAARTLDADLLLYGEQLVDLPELEVPHPRMTFRPFVMRPAAEVAAGMRHPRLAATLAELDDRRRAGDDAVAIVGGSPGDREWVAGETARIAPPLVTRSGDTPKLQVCLDADTPPLPGTPALWLPPDHRERWPAELAAAIECVWTAS